MRIFFFMGNDFRDVFLLPHHLFMERIPCVCVFMWKRQKGKEDMRKLYSVRGYQNTLPVGIIL